MLTYGTLRALHGNGYAGAEKKVGSAFFLKLVRSLVFCDPACAENRVRWQKKSILELITSLSKVRVRVFERRPSPDHAIDLT